MTGIVFASEADLQAKRNGPVSTRSTKDGPRARRMRNGGRHRCQPPLSVFVPAPRSASGRSARPSTSDRTGASQPAPNRSGDGSVGPLSGAGLTWKALHHLVRASAEAVALPKRWTAFPVRSGPPQLVGIAAFRDRVPVDVLVGSARFRPAGLATTLWVSAIRRLCRPMIGSCHEPVGPPTEKARKSSANLPRLWISPALATSGFAAAFL